MKLLCGLILAVLGTAGAYKSYSGYQILRTQPLSKMSVTLLTPLLLRSEFDFLSSPRVGHPVDVMTSPEHVQELTDTLDSLGLLDGVLVPDVGVAVQVEKARIETIKQNEKLTGRAPAFDRFMDYDEIQAYLDEVVTNFPEIATLETIGTSYEGRIMRVLKLSNGPGKAAIWFDAGIHAREWIGIPVNLYIINELTEKLATNQALLDNNDFYFLPVVNPDGYSYTWTDDRYWRKTRSPNAGSSCVGTDPNRNFDWHWGEDTSLDPCSNNWHGSAPLSEPEVKALADFLTNNPSITFHVALHSQGKQMLSPWSWTTDLPEHYDEMTRVGNEAAAALEAVRGTVYEVGSAANTLYSSFGNCKDFAYGALKILFSYTIELPAGGPEGHDPPPEEIIPVVTETWEAMKVMIANIPPSRG